MKRIFTGLFLAFLSMNSFASSATELLVKAEQAIEQEEYEVAFEYYNQAIQLEPDNAVIYFLRGIVNSEELEEELAIADYNKALELGFAKIDLYYHRGLSNEYLERYEEAVTDLTIYLNSSVEKQEPMIVTAYSSRGSCNYDLGNITAALDDYNAAIKLDPTDVEHYKMKADIYSSNKQYDKAIKEYENMRKLFPAKDINMRANIVREKNKAGDFAGALEDSAQLLQEKYPSDYLYHYRAEAYLGLGKYKEAKKEINKALNKRPKNKEYLKTKEKIEKASKG